MKSPVLLTIFGAILATTIVSSQTVIPGGNVSGTWVAFSSPYLIEGEITVPSDSTLNIEPGVEVNFQGHYKLIVNGFLEAMGTESDSILFTTSDTSDGWHGIRFIDAPDSSHLSFCIIKHGQASGDSPDTRGGGIYCENSNPQISHCTITGNLACDDGGGIYCSTSSPTISWCTITGNSAAGTG